MPDDAMFTLKLEPELRDQFMAEAAAARLPAAQILRDFMLSFVKQQREAREHRAWFGEEVAQGMREADDPGVKRISHEEVASSWTKQRALLLKRADEPAG